MYLFYVVKCECIKKTCDKATCTIKLYYCGYYYHCCSSNRET